MDYSKKSLLRITEKKKILKYSSWFHGYNRAVKIESLARIC